MFIFNELDGSLVEVVVRFLISVLRYIVVVFFKVINRILVLLGFKYIVLEIFVIR